MDPPYPYYDPRPPPPANSASFPPISSTTSHSHYDYHHTHDDYYPQPGQGVVWVPEHHPSPAAPAPAPPHLDYAQHYNTYPPPYEQPQYSHPPSHTQPDRPLLHPVYEPYPFPPSSSFNFTLDHQPAPPSPYAHLLPYHTPSSTTTHDDPAQPKRRRVSFAVPDDPSQVQHPPLISPSTASFNLTANVGVGLSMGAGTPAATPSTAGGLSAHPSPAASSSASQLKRPSIADLHQVAAGESGSGSGDGGAVTVEDELQAAVEEAGKGTRVDKAEKSCKNCRSRKVRCSRTWPSCTRCTSKNLTCHYGNLIPIDLVKNLSPSTRVAKLEARIKALELEVATSRAAAVGAGSGRGSPATGGAAGQGGKDERGRESLSARLEALPFALRPLSLQILQAVLSSLPAFSPSPSFFSDSPPSAPVLPQETLLAHARAVLRSVRRRATELPASTMSGHVGGRSRASELDREGKGEEKITGGGGGGGGGGDGRYGPPTAMGCGGGASYSPPPSSSSAPSSTHPSAGAETDPDALAWARWVALVRSDEEAARGMEEVLEAAEREEEGAAGRVEGWVRGEGEEGGRWPRWVAWGSLDAFWSTCSSNVPTFRAFHTPHRKLRLYTALAAPLFSPYSPSPSSSRAVGVGGADEKPLTSGERVVVLALAALGVRGSMDLDFFLLSPSSSPSSSSSSSPVSSGEPSLAIRRELLTRALRLLMLETYDQLEVGVGEGTRDAVEASLFAGAVMMWNELVPRRSRALIRSTLGLYKDLVDSTLAAAVARFGGQEGGKERIEGEVAEVVGMYGLPLIVQDSTTAAYLRSSPLITPSDLTAYFPASPLPSFPPSPSAHAAFSAPPTLAEDMAVFLDLDRLEGANHEQLLMGSVLGPYKWLAGCLRWVAEMSCPKSLSTPLSAASLSSLFSTLDSIHAALHSIQRHVSALPTPFAHPSCLAPGPGGDTCESVHLRFATRLDRETDDVVWLVYSAVGERMLREEMRGVSAVKPEGEEEVVGDGERLDVGWLRMCEGKVRKGLKLAAFYFNFFQISPDPHQTHHLAWSLELIPSWTFLATQRYHPSPSPSHPSFSSGAPTLDHHADELTETELDWIETGLEEACKYHPVAEKRLVEIRAYREGNRRAAEESGAGVIFPSRPTPSLMDYDPAYVSSTTAGAVASTSASGSLLDPSTAAKTGKHPRLTFQQALRTALRMSVPNWA
ncbi:hypothetical protein JCM8097_003820 [Rhodosporidiobolus ruineniae]